MRLSRLHAFLAKHCSEYAKTCLAVHPPKMLNLSALDSPTDVSHPLIGMKYLRNLPTAADGSVASFTVLIFSFLLYSLWQSINSEFMHAPTQVVAFEKTAVTCCCRCPIKVSYSCVPTRPPVQFFPSLWECHNISFHSSSIFAGSVGFSQSLSMCRSLF